MSAASGARPREGRTLFVLGGGGALGAYQAGALVAMFRAGIQPDVLFGASAGALNAAFLASDPSVRRAEQLGAWWTDPGTSSVLTPSPWSRLRSLAAAATARSNALMDDRPLRRLVAAHVPAHDLSELAVPLSITTTCLDCGEARHHVTGPVGDTLVASCSLPGIFPPVSLGEGHLHVDAGVVCGVPVDAAVAAAAPNDRIFVLDCGLAPVTSEPLSCAAGSPIGPLACGLPISADSAPYQVPAESSYGALDVVLRSFTVARAVANRAVVQQHLEDPRVHVLPHVADAWAAGLLPRLPAGPRDFRHTRSVVAAGLRATELWLAGSSIPHARRSYDAAS